MRFGQPGFDWLGCRAGAVMATDSLHGAKVGAGSLCSVEEVALAVGEVLDTAPLSSPPV